MFLWDNLPGWRWARIKQLALVGLSSSWHSEACNALRDSTGVAYSEISVRGNQRTRGCQQNYIVEPLSSEPRKIEMGHGLPRYDLVSTAHVSMVKADIPSRPFGYDQV